MTRINQLLALEKARRNSAERELTDTYKSVQKPELFAGRLATYQPYDENGDKQPDQAQPVQLRAEEILQKIVDCRSVLYDTIASKDASNMKARASIVVDGITIVKDAPVVFLLYWDKQMTDLQTLVSKVPTLPADRQWTWDPNTNQYVAAPVRTYTTKKVPRAFVKAEATKEHPAIAETVFEDVQVGAWTTVHYSGAIPAERKAKILERIRKLQEAGRIAREEANNLTVEDLKVAEAMFKYLFAK